MIKDLPVNAGNIRVSLGGEHPLEEGMATHFSILAWRIPWTEELDKLQSIGSQRVGMTEETACMHMQNNALIKEHLKTKIKLC